jgi:hypothetical protein
MNGDIGGGGGGVFRVGGRRASLEFISLTCGPGTFIPVASTKQGRRHGIDCAPPTTVAYGHLISNIAARDHRD